MSEETSTTTAEATNDLGLPQDLYDRAVAFQDEPYPGDEAFKDESEAGDLTLTRGQAFQLRSALHAAIAEVLQAVQMRALFGPSDDGDSSDVEALTEFLDLNDRLVAITEPVPAGV